MRMIFLGIEEASSATVAEGTTFADVCAVSLEGLSFLCKWVEIVKPIVVVSYLEFWIWELGRSFSKKINSQPSLFLHLVSQC